MEEGCICGLIVFKKFGQRAECLLGVAGQPLCYFGEVGKGLGDFLLLVVLEANEHELITYDLLLDDLVEFSIVFKGPIDAGKLVLRCGVGQGEGYVENDFIGAGIGAGVGQLGDLAAGMVLKTPKDEVIASYVEGEYDEEKCSEEFSHGRLGVWDIQS